MSRCMPDLSDTACSMRPALARCSPRRRPIRWSQPPPPSRRQAGVLFIVKNYAGDCMNFEMAAEFCDGATATVVTNDDVAVENSTHSDRPARCRRHAGGGEDRRRGRRERHGSHSLQRSSATEVNGQDRARWAWR